MSPNELSEQEIIRRESLKKLKNSGIDPYPAAMYEINLTAVEIKKGYVNNPENDKYKKVSLAGRIMNRRIMGKASFAEIQDHTGRIQIYINRDEICPEEDKSLYNEIFKKLLDIGDFIGVKGFVFRTQMGEISIHVKELTVLSKSLRPLPVVKSKEGKIYDAFTDPEQRYRMRYVDLIVNPQVKDILSNAQKSSIPCGKCSMSMDTWKWKHLFCNLYRVEQQQSLLSHTITHWIYRFTCALQMNFT